jgi:hypothetical protein
MKKKILILGLLFTTSTLIFAQDAGGVSCEKTSEIEIVPGLTIRTWTCSNGCTSSTLAFMDVNIDSTPEICNN